MKQIIESVCFDILSYTIENIIIFSFKDRCFLTYYLII